MSTILDICHSLASGCDLKRTRLEFFCHSLFSGCNFKGQILSFGGFNVKRQNMSSIILWSVVAMLRDKTWVLSYSLVSGCNVKRQNVSSATLSGQWVQY